MSPAVVVSDVAQVPDGWRIARLGDVLRLEYGVPLPERDRLPGDTPVIGSAGVIGFHSQATHAGPAVIVGRKGSIGTVTWVPVDCVPIDTTYCALPVEDKLADLRWIYRVLNREDLAGLNRATGVPGLNRDDVHALNRLIPPVGEQRAIASVLDSIDEAIERADEVIAAAERLRDSLLYELLTRGLPGQHSEWKQVSGLGTIPASWKAIRLGNVVDINRDSWLPGDEEEIIYYLDLTAVFAPGLVAEPREIGSAEAPSRARRRVQSGDILVSTVRPNLRGFARITRAINNLIASTGFAVLTARQSTINSFIYHHVMTPCFAAYLENATTGQAYPAVRPADVAAYKLGLPPLSEQRAIAAVLDSVDASIERARDQRIVLSAAATSIADALLTGRVRVDQRKKEGHGPNRKG